MTINVLNGMGLSNERDRCRQPVIQALNIVKTQEFTHDGDGLISIEFCVILVGIIQLLRG